MPMFTIKEKQIDLFIGQDSTSPIIYLNTFENEGKKVWDLIKGRGLCSDFTLIAISGLTWNKDMVPWDNPPTFKNGQSYVGGADDYLDIFAKQIVPTIEDRYTLKPLWRGIAGYSLAGLFAIYSLYRTGLFQRAASISGSLWFPGFKQYAFSLDAIAEISHLYFSLGDRENNTKNPYMKTVLYDTEQIVSHYKEKEIKTFFELNPGNHFQNDDERTVKGIEWLLSH